MIAEEARFLNLDLFQMRKERRLSIIMIDEEKTAKIKNEDMFIETKESNSKSISNIRYYEIKPKVKRGLLAWADEDYQKINEKLKC